MVRNATPNLFEDIDNDWVMPFVYVKRDLTMSDDRLKDIVGSLLT